MSKRSRKGRAPASAVLLTRLIWAARQLKEDAGGADISHIPDALKEFGVMAQRGVPVHGAFVATQPDIEVLIDRAAKLRFGGSDAKRESTRRFASSRTSTNEMRSRRPRTAYAQPTATRTSTRPWQFDTTRSPLGELVYQLKYRNGPLNDIIETAVAFITERWSGVIDCAVPPPPSLHRARQPAVLMASGVATSLGVPSFAAAAVKATATPQMKNVPLHERAPLGANRQRAALGCYAAARRRLARRQSIARGQEGGVDLGGAPANSSPLRIAASVARSTRVERLSRLRQGRRPWSEESKVPSE